MESPRFAGGTSTTLAPSIKMRPPLTSSSPAIIRRSVVLPQPDGPTKTTNDPSSISRSAPGMTICGPKALLTRSSVILPMVLLSGSALYLTAPKVSPRTSCRWLNQPRTSIGAMARVEAADSFAQNSPSGLE